VYCIKSYRLFLYRGKPDITCITADLAAVTIKGHSRPVTRRMRAPFNRPWYHTGGGWGAGGGRLKYYTSLPMTPWWRSNGSWPPATDDTHPLHQQPVITTVSTVNRTNASTNEPVLQLTEWASWFVAIRWWSAFFSLGWSVPPLCVSFLSLSDLPDLMI